PLPVSAWPPAIVRPEMDTASPASTWNTRERLPPLTISWSAPGPLIFRSSVMSSSPPVRAMVPISPSSKTMVSAPAWALAWPTAARSEPSPPSARVVTWNAAGTTRASSDSRPSRARAGFRTAAAGRPRPRNHFETERRTDISDLQGEEGTRRANTRRSAPPARQAAARRGRLGLERLDVSGLFGSPLGRGVSRASRSEQLADETRAGGDLDALVEEVAEQLGPRGVGV